MSKKHRSKHCHIAVGGYDNGTPLYCINVGDLEHGGFKNGLPLAYPLCTEEQAIEWMPAIDEYIDAYIERVSPSGWQPIETAPKDGTVVDLWMSGPYSKEGYRTADCWFGGGEWLQAYGDFHSPSAHATPKYNPRDEPTHWMPLPEPPGAA